MNEYFPKIYKGDPKPRIPPCVGVGSHRVHIGSLKVSVNHARKNKSKTNIGICMQCGVLHVLYIHAQIAVDAGDLCT